MLTTTYLESLNLKFVDNETNGNDILSKDDKLDGYIFENVKINAPNNYSDHLIYAYPNNLFRFHLSRTEHHFLDLKSIKVLGKNVKFNVKLCILHDGCIISRDSKFIGNDSVVKLNYVPIPVCLVPYSNLYIDIQMDNSSEDISFEFTSNNYILNERNIKKIVDMVFITRDDKDDKSTVVYMEGSASTKYLS